VRTTLLLVLTSAAWGCARPPADASFRERDAALLGVFAALEGRCAPSWKSGGGCLARLRELRAEEVQLFAEVRAHRFADLTESNYWHRGRLKFPGEIEQALGRVEAPRE
jgi:hypothetical protein